MNTRDVEIEGEAWIASLAGASTAGSGALGLGRLDGVDFARASDAGKPIREALIQRGTFDMLYDEEIVALFRQSHAITERVPPRKSLEPGSSLKRSQ